jgi:hypothetical protein
LWVFWRKTSRTSWPHETTCWAGQTAAATRYSDLAGLPSSQTSLRDLVGRAQFSHRFFSPCNGYLQGLKRHGQRRAVIQSKQWRRVICGPGAPVALLRSLNWTSLLESQILPAQDLSVSGLMCDLLHFSQQTGLHVENEAAHGDVFGNPGMRCDFLDLLQGIFLGVLIGEEAHRNRRSVSG